MTKMRTKSRSRCVNPERSPRTTRPGRNSNPHSRANNVGAVNFPSGNWRPDNSPLVVPPDATNFPVFPRVFGKASARNQFAHVPPSKHPAGPPRKYRRNVRQYDDRLFPFLSAFIGTVVVPPSVVSVMFDLQYRPRPRTYGIPLRGKSRPVHCAAPRFEQVG